MKSIKVFMIIIGLMGILVMMAVFMNLHTKIALRNLQSTENSKGFVVVELFTSEGCSSCPPADKLIEKIERNNKNKQIYIMAFHVDYWDHLGWKDHFSDQEFSNRQRQYASWLKLHTLYTPQFVVNGTTEYVGSDQGLILKAISTELDEEPTNTLMLYCKLEGGKVNIEYQGAGNEKKSELVLALIQKLARSDIRAGENSGKSLLHVQIVRQLLHVDINSKKDIAMYLPDDFKGKGWELIGLVQHKTDGRIISAARYDFQSKQSGQQVLSVIADGIK